MWWLFHPIDSIIGSFAFTLPSICLNFPFFISLPCAVFLFGSKGDILMMTQSFVRRCLRVETLCFSSVLSYSFMCIVSRLDLCGGYSTLY